MLIKVIKTQKAASCPMGVKTKVYEAKEEPQEIHDDLAKVFIKEGWGILVNEPVNNSQEEEEMKAAEEQARIAAEELAEKEELLEEAEAFEIEGLSVENSIEELKEAIEAKREEIKSGDDESENKAIKKSPKNKSFADNQNINNKKNK